MKRLGRNWRKFKWVGAIVTMAFAIAWALAVTRSIHLEKAVINGCLVVRFGEGRLRVFTMPTTGPNMWRCDREIVHMAEWSLGLTRPTLTRDEFTLPMWLPLLAFMLPTVALWWRDRCLPAHCCQSCGYDLTGNTGGACPKCGRRT